MVKGHRSMPVLPTEDVLALSEWFQVALGFSKPKVWNWVGRPNFSIQGLGRITIACQWQETFAPRTCWEAYLYVDDVEALYALAVSNGADVPHAPYETFYGMKEIEIRTPEGHLLAFGQDISPGSDDPVSK